MMRDIYEFFWVGVFISFVMTSAIWITLNYINKQPTELACREGKLFEMSHEGNITIYGPTFDDCEVTK